MNFLDILKSTVLWACLASYLTAQIIKTVIGSIRQKRFNWRLLFANGGMPSSHTSTVTTLFIMSGIINGFASLEAAISFVLMVIVMADAAGVRRAAGQQAKVLNEILDLLEHKEAVPGGKLKELLGHTPLQVVIGAIIGIVVALATYFIVA